jgi:hypothetical protein
MFDSIDSRHSPGWKHDEERELPAWLAADLGVSPSIPLLHRGGPSRAWTGCRRIARSIRSVFGGHAVETAPSSEPRGDEDGSVPRLEHRRDEAAEGSRAA